MSPVLVIPVTTVCRREGRGRRGEEEEREREARTIRTEERVEEIMLTWYLSSCTERDH